MPEEKPVLLIPGKRLLLEQYLHEQFSGYDPATKVLDVSGATELWYKDSKQAKQYDTITRINYAGIEMIIRSIENKIPHGKVAIVDYGCGNGLKGIYIHHHLQTLGRLYFVDDNEEILTIAERNAEEKGLKTLAIRANLSHSRNLFKWRQDSSRFHLFLGQTVGNPNHPEDFIESIALSMRKGEYLLVEWLKTTKEHYGAPRENQDQLTKEEQESLK